MKVEPAQQKPRAGQVDPAEAKNGGAEVDSSQFVLSLLEADQLVAAKGRTRFGKRNLPLGVKLLLWGLRIYVIIMLVIVLVSVLRALHGMR